MIPFYPLYLLQQHGSVSSQLTINGGTTDNYCSCSHGSAYPTTALCPPGGLRWVSLCLPWTPDEHVTTKVTPGHRPRTQPPSAWDRDGNTYSQSWPTLPIIVRYRCSV